MKGTKKIKTRIIAGMLSLVTVFSVGACSVTTASAAGAPSVASIAKDVSNFAIDQVIDKYVTNGIAGSLLKMGTGYLLNWIFDEKEEEKKTVDDAIKEIDKLRQTMEENHKEEMNSLKVINGSIDTQTFRKAADSLHDDYSTVLEKISNNARNITASGEGKINENTYKAYKAILADSTCNLSKLEKNFRVMRDYVLGKRLSTNRQSGYEATTKYLFDKVTEKYKETAHSWKDSLDYLKVVRSNINGELTTIHFDAGMDYITMLTLNNMAYKVREYEIENGIYEANDNEQPYAYFENFAKDLTDSLSSVNDIYKSVIEENNNNGDFMQATSEIPNAVGGKNIKGFHTITEAWAQSFKASPTYTITLNGDIKADPYKGFNYEGLPEGQYDFKNNGGFQINYNRNITFDLNGHTIDCTANKIIFLFDLYYNATLTIKDGTIVGGACAVCEGNKSNDTLVMKNVTIRNTSLSPINFWDDDRWSTAHSVTLDDCHVENCQRIQITSCNAKVNVTNSTFTNNWSNLTGGAFYLPSTQYPTFENCTFKGNKAMQGCGGAIDAKSVICKNCNFENNTSEENNQYGTKGAGGAIAANALKLYDCTFTGNTTNDQAGAVWCCGGQNYTQIIERCTFDNNSSKNVGGAVRIDLIEGNAHSIKNCTFTNNTSGRGAAVLVENFCGHCDDIAYHWGNSGSNNRNTTGYDARKVVAEFAWGLSGARR